MTGFLKGLLLIMFAGVLGGVPVWASEPGEDHPLLSRYEGAEMRGYEQSGFDAVVLPVGPLGEDRAPTETLDLTGRVTWIAYQLPSGRSTMEIRHNYEQALAGDGYDIVFACTGDACGNGNQFHQHIYQSGDVMRGGSRMLWRIGSHNSRAHYLVAHRDDGQSSVHIMLHIVESSDNRYLRQIVVEAEPMDTGRVTAGVRDADELRESLDTEGRAVVDGIFFEFDSAEILPESADALEQMATLMQRESGLEVYIVGHSDNQGSLAYNRDLSERRAGAVLRVLANEYGIQAARMEAHGVASLAPLASNVSEEGRALNRRVELVAQ